jgi:peptide/nickel transport system substrate-binding protein
MDDQIKLWLPASFGRRQLILGAGAAVFLAACGGDDDSVGESDSTTPGTGGTAAPPATGNTSGTTGTAAPTPGSAGAAGAAKAGGTLRVGIVGSTNDIIDGQYIVARADQARTVAGWEPIANYDTDFNISFEHSVAEEIDVQAPDLYVIRLKEGIEFHNGKTMTADDLVYSFQRRLDPDLGLAPALAEFLDTNGVTKVDDRTVQLQLLKPNVTFLNGLAEYTATVVPVGYSREDPEQVGTGPYKLVSFTPGAESVHVRHENYWGTSYLDEVQIIDFADQSALVNALTSGEIDVAIDLPYAQVGTVEANTDFVILESAAGNWQTITMAIDQAPFDDVRVRQAMRLIANREELVQRVLSGHGRVGNDMYGVLDASYPEFPQREQDIEAAMALLAEAGQEGLEIELFAPDDTAGLPEYAAAFAEQAKAAGINVKATVLDGGTYWGDEYTKRTFATSYWSTRPYLNQVAAGSLPTATYPETHWPPAGSNFEDLYNEAVAEVDDDKRFALIEEMQRQEYEEGGNIIAYFQNLVDAHATYVMGAVARANLLNFDHFGRGFKNIWLDQ